MNLNEETINFNYEFLICKKDMHLVESKDHIDGYEMFCGEGDMNILQLERSVM